MDEMSPWARGIFLQKYSYDGKENWSDTAIRVSSNVMGAVGASWGNVREISNLIAQRKFIPGGRYLYASGRGFKQTQNCLDGKTKIVTKKGVYSLEELENQPIEILNRYGEWEEATVSSFGIQELLKVTFSNGEIIRATPEHRWYTPSGTVETTETIQEVPFTKPPKIELDPDGIRNGIIFGDGSKSKNGNYSYIVFVNPEKDEALVDWFENKEVEVTVGFGAKPKYNTIRKTKAGTIVSLQPARYKDFPAVPYTPEYARGFIAGLIATDGCVPRSGSVQIACEGLEKAKLIAEIASVGGCVVNSVRVTSKINPYTGGPREMCTVSIKPFTAPIILPSHLENIQSRNLRDNFRMSLDVESVESDGVEEVYCVVAPSHSFTLANGLTTGNCLLLKAEDSREGWAELLQKAGMALMTGAGIGVDYSDVRGRGSIITRTGGTASGPTELMQIVNEIGRHVMQGGSRRSAIWAGLSWKHPDIDEFIRLKDWSEEVRRIKETDFNFPATMDMTNVSVCLDDEFFDAFHNPQHKLHSHAQHVYWTTVRRMCKTAEPGFSIDVGDNAGETLRNAPVSGESRVLTDSGYKKVIDIVGRSTRVWTGEQWAPNVVFKETNPNTAIYKVTMSGGRSIRCDPEHPFLVESYSGKGKRKKYLGSARVAAKDLVPGQVLKVSMPQQYGSLDSDAYALGYAYGDGSISRTGKVEITLCTTESRKALPVLVKAKNFSSVTEPDKRGFARIYYRTDPVLAGATKGEFPSSIYSASTNEIISFIAGLFDSDGNWEPTQGRIRLASKHWSFLDGTARLMEQVGILSGISKAGISTFGKHQGYQLVVYADYTDVFTNLIPTFRIKPELVGKGYRKSVIKVLSVEQDGEGPVYCADVKVSEHSFMAEGVIISNCTEVTSRDDSDICNLGSINMARINSAEEMSEVVSLATQFLVAGTVYSDVPYLRVGEVRSKNRRLGLGLMGMHEWLLLRGKPYAPDEELGELLSIYADSTNIAHGYEDYLGLSRSVKTRAIAPTGTIGIIGETTTGIEPIFCSAYKRRYLAGGTEWKYQYVVDPTAKRVLDSGIDASSIEDAYSLAQDVEKRVAFQHWVQGYVDHGISSTINLPHVLRDDDAEAFGRMLIKYLPGLRGMTVFPDGSRGGQPLSAIDLNLALEHEGVVFESEEEVCVGGVCGI